MDGVGSSDAILLNEQEEEWEGSSDAILCEGLATEFWEGYEMSLHVLWAKIKLPASLIMNMEAQQIGGGGETDLGAAPRLPCVRAIVAGQ